MYEQLNMLLKGSHFTKKRIAQHLFPNKRYSYQALVRVLSGKGEFSATQMQQLAELLGVTVSELYGEKPKREWRIAECGSGCIRLATGGYDAILYWADRFTPQHNIYSLTLLPLVAAIVPSRKEGLKGALTFSQLINLLEQMIAEYETSNL